MSDFIKGIVKLAREYRASEQDARFSIAARLNKKQKIELQNFQQWAEQNFQQQYPDFQLISIEYNQMQRKFQLKCKCKNHHDMFISLPIKRNLAITCKKCWKQITYCYIRFIRQRCNSPENTKTTSIDLQKYRVTDSNVRNQDHSDEFGTIGISNTQINAMIKSPSGKRMVKNLAQKIKNADYDKERKCFKNVTLTSQQQDLLYEIQNTIQRTVDQHFDRHKSEQHPINKEQLLDSIKQTKNIKAFYARLYQYEINGYFDSINLYNKIRSFVINQLNNLPNDVEQ